MTFSMERSFEVLQRTPGVFEALLGGLSDDWTLTNYGESTFSPFDVIGHMIHAERSNWMTRLRLILDHGEAATFSPFDRYAMYEASKGKSISDLLAEFAMLRAKSLQDLRALNLTTEMLDRRAIHPQLGPVTARQLLATWVVHDLGHTHQVVKSMAFQYHEAVGPYREFLSILPRA